MENLDIKGKDRIICLVGASGSGKTTICRKLEDKGFNVIKSYTTREQRESNEWGHIFIDKLTESNGFITGLNKCGEEILVADRYKKGEMIALKGLYNEIYFATKEQYQGKGTSIYIVDPQGAEMVKENVKDAEVVTIFLIAEEVLRLRRMRANRDIEQCHNRIYEDREVFKTCKCDYVVDANREVEEVLKDVVDIIG